MQSMKVKDDIKKQLLMIMITRLKLMNFTRKSMILKLQPKKRMMLATSLIVI